MTTADTFFDEASPPPDMEWNPPRLQPEVDPVSSSPWFIAMASVALGVVLRLLMLVDILEPPSLAFGLGWAVALTGCATATVLLARNNEALTGRHVADVVLLGLATGAFSSLFPHDRGAELIAVSERIGTIALHAAAGWLVGAVISLALARARTSISRVSLLIADGLTLLGALFLRGSGFGTVGLALLLAAWACAIAGWNERVRFTQNQGPPATLRSPRSMVSFATALTAAMAIVESFTKGLWADEIPMVFLLGLLFVAAVVSVVDARRQTAAAAGSADQWSEWRSSVETGVLGEEGAVSERPGDHSSERRPALDFSSPGGTDEVMDSPFRRPAVAPIFSGSTTDTDAIPAVPGSITSATADADDHNPWLVGDSGDAASSADATGTGTGTSVPSEAFIPAPASNTAAAGVAAHTSSLPFRTRSELQAFPAASAWTDDGEFLGANAAFWDLFGAVPGDAFNLLSLIHPEDRPAFALHLARGTRTNLPFRTIVRLQGASSTTPGHRLDVAAGPYQADSSPLGDVPNATYQVSLNGPVEDIADPESETAGMFDPLTGLGNAEYLEHWIAERAEHVRRRTDRPLLVILELANLGHYEQSEPRLRDLIQTEVAYALHTVCRSGDFVVRLDGPYFAAVIEGVLDGDEWYVLHRFEEIVKGTVSIAGRTYKVDGRLLPLRPNPGATLTDILDQVAALLVAPPPDRASRSSSELSGPKQPIRQIAIAPPQTTSRCGEQAMTPRSPRAQSPCCAPYRNPTRAPTPRTSATPTMPMARTTTPPLAANKAINPTQLQAKRRQRVDSHSVVTPARRRLPWSSPPPRPQSPPTTPKPNTCLTPVRLTRTATMRMIRTRLTFPVSTPRTTSRRVRRHGFLSAAGSIREPRHSLPALWRRRGTARLPGRRGHLRHVRELRHHLATRPHAALSDVRQRRSA